MGDVEFGLFVLGLIGLWISVAGLVERWKQARHIKQQVGMLHERVVKALAAQPHLVQRADREGK